jgi:hypothetical protein
MRSFEFRSEKMRLTEDKSRVRAISDAYQSAGGYGDGDDN